MSGLCLLLLHVSASNDHLANEADLYVLVLALALAARRQREGKDSEFILAHQEILDLLCYFRNLGKESNIDSHKQHV